jgi:hypothetical protein
LFDAAAAWQRAASKVRVVQVPTQFIVKGNEADLLKTFEGLRRLNMSLAVGVGFLYGQGQCGYHVEGYAAHHTARLLARRIKRLGGSLAYAAMDEPLWFGRYATGPNTCHADLPEVVRQVAEGVAEIHEVFPEAKIGDIEPIGVSTPTPWPKEILEFAEAYRAAVGAPLSFIRADVQWNKDWQAQLRIVAAGVRAAGIAFSLIVDSDQPGQTDLEWTQRAESRFEDARAALGSLPDQLVFQSWQKHPQRFVPETEAGTLTSLVNKAPR